MDTFGQFKTLLSDYLVKDVCHKLCEYFELPPGKKENILQGTSVSLSLLDYLSETDIIRPLDLTKLEEALQKFGNATPALKKIQEYHQSGETLETSQPRSGKGQHIFPVDVESDEEDNDDGHDDKILTFEELITHLGLEEQVVRKLRLNDFLTIKDNTKLSLVELFWQKLSSLDYRARSNIFLSSHSPSITKQISVKDFIFAIMHCSDTFLRQDIIEKMSACQLAVPVLLKGVQGKKTEFLTWSLRRVVKKWKEEDSIAKEEHMINYPVFSVSFLRIGDIKNFSKSETLNMLLGPHLGNVAHPYFLCKQDDPGASGFSEGCAEAVWYLPVPTSNSEKLKRVLLLLNLRGDSNCLPVQTRFLCQASNLIIAFIATRNQSRNEHIIEKIQSMASVCKFIAINDERTSPLKKRRKYKWNENWLFIRYLEPDSLCNEICSIISNCHQKCNSRNIRTLEQMTDLCEANIDVEESDTKIQTTKSSVREICNPKEIKNLTEFKNQLFPLQFVWKDWVDIDMEILKPNIDNTKPVEELRDDLLARKHEIRTKQLSRGLSDTVTKFYCALDNVTKDKENLGYFVFYFQEQLLCMTKNHIKNHFTDIAKCKKDLSLLDDMIKAKNKEKANNETSQSKESQDTVSRLKKKRKEYTELCQKENEHSKQEGIGWEHFFRELGQWYEAHAEVAVEKGDISVTLLPALAAGLLINGYSLELLDGDTGRVPISWVTSVLDQLVIDLKDPPILVLSVVGIQSSGKSTFLNSMFGVRFPVRSGRCTRGMVVRLLQVEDEYAKQVGFNFIFLIDSEGMRSIERTAREGCRFDNELVTLALCISDVAILNIEGENIGPDMTGILQIAAHAMIRMKEVDLHSQCRIIQQRVSDPTAKKRNKGGMEQVINILNEAIVVAAREEGFENRYTNISDVLNLHLDENLQFLPCLWTGPMSPPSQFYGDIIMNLKVDLLNDLESKGLEPQFTVSTLTHRIRDVWRAVKSEHFLFYFEDSVKAIDFNKLSMKLNEWIINVRIDISEKVALWRRRVTESNKDDDTILKLLERECHDELQVHKTKIQDYFRSFVSGHQRQNAVQRYEKRVNDTIEDVLMEIERNVISVLKEDYRTNQLEYDISSLVAQVRGKLQTFFKNATSLDRPRTSQHELSANSFKGNPEDIFCNIWEQFLQDMDSTDFRRLSQNTSEQWIRAHCEDLLLSVTHGKALSSDIQLLMKSEGGIENHLIVPNWMEYFPSKGKDEHVKKWFLRYEKSLQDIVDESLNEMKEMSAGKSFDANLFQLLLQKALQNLSLKFESSEPPYLLKGKVLLHICSKIFQVVLQNQSLYDTKNSFQSLLENKKTSLYNEFTALQTCEGQTNKVNPYLKSLFVDWAKDLIIIGMKQRILRHVSKICNITDKSCLNRHILSHLLLKDSFEEYLAYIQNHKQYIKNWVNEFVLKYCAAVTDKGNGLQLCLELTLRTELHRFSRIVTRITDNLKVNHFSAKDKTAYCMDWVNTFVTELHQRGFTRSHELATFLQDYHLSDIEDFVEELKSYIQEPMKSDVMKALDIPIHQNETEIRNYVLSRLFDDPSNEMLQRVCLEQCPICKATCENNWQTGSFHEHTTSTHIPRGIRGIISHKTKQLMLHNCIVCVDSPNASYQIAGDETKYLCKDYKNVFPAWSIRPQTSNNYDDYWKWVMVRLNESLAAHYKCIPASIPNSWRKITKDEVVSSLGLKSVESNGPR